MSPPRSEVAQTERVELGDFHLFVPSRWTRADGATERSIGWVDTKGAHDLVTSAERIAKSQGELGLCVRRYAVGRVAHAVKSADVKDPTMGTPWFEERGEHVIASCSASMGDGSIHVAIVGKPCTGEGENDYAMLSIVVVRGDVKDEAKEAEALLAEVLESVDVVPS